MRCRDAAFSKGLLCIDRLAAGYLNKHAVDLCDAKHTKL